ncbi:MAG: hypothetical protein JWO20_3341 [Candidatus Angelobacter sp.]|jgi:hypothetical protein|nr:hypothetical protein [Candidatus Angelobacter sp.]
MQKCNSPSGLVGAGRSCCRQNSIQRRNNMQPEIFDALVTYSARVLEVMFIAGAAGSVVVFVSTVYDILTDIFKPDTRERREIDAIQRAA